MFCSRLGWRTCYAEWLIPGPKSEVMATYKEPRYADGTISQAVYPVIQMSTWQLEVV